MNTQGDLFDTYPQWLISEPARGGTPGSQGGRP